MKANSIIIKYINMDDDTDNMDLIRAYKFRVYPDRKQPKMFIATSIIDIYDA